MAHNTQVTADHNAPPITRILAEFVADHPSRGWDDAVDDEAKRTIYNWAGCAIGASRHPTLEAALAAVRELEPSPQAGILGRSDRVDIASAALTTVSARTPSTSTIRICGRLFIRPDPSFRRRSRWPSIDRFQDVS